jgi:predicted ATPase
MATKPTAYAALLRQQQEIAAQLAQAREAGLQQVRATIEETLVGNGFRPEEVFPELGRGRGQGKKSGTVRQARTPKYSFEGNAIDGRSARAHPAFEAIKVDGRIDDGKARDRGLLNPQWVSEQRKGVLEAIGIRNPEAYVKKHG